MTEQLPKARISEWLGALDTDVLNPSLVADNERLTDAAKVGDWDAVISLITKSSWVTPNSWRISGQSWFTPLHQAAWHGAPVDTVEQLVALGGWRSLRTADGERAIDIAKARGHNHLLEALATREPTVRDIRRYTAWDTHLTALIAERTRSLEPARIRPVQTEVLGTEALSHLWFPYPGMYGGFRMSVHERRLFVESWIRVVGGSGQAHVITESGCVLVEEGFV